MRTFDRNNLPVPVEEMGLHKKKRLTPMVLAEGPFTVVTQEGPWYLKEGWRGLIAIDSFGYPYPITLDEYHASYEPVGDMRVPVQ